MKVLLKSKYLLFLALFSSSLVNAETYLELSTGLIFVSTPADTARPTLLDLRLGYATADHQLELALMTSVKEGSVNQLDVDVPSIVSVLYHYIPETRSSLKFHAVLGASWIEVESSFPGFTNPADEFYGVSYGIGFEEHFESIPQLKISIDFMQLYRGDQLDIYTTNWGVHYEF